MSNIINLNNSENAMVQEIMAMHSYRRPHGSQTEKEYRDRFIVPLGAVEDQNRNLILKIGENPKTLWSSHTDSVHRGEGPQRIILEGDIIKLHKKSKSSCLGADDAAGNWLMMEMIRAQVPGLYVFHHAEEVGGIGSNALLKNNPELLHGIQAAVAFDRKGKTSVITHQGARTCSDAFAKSLAVQLPEGYKIDTGGTFTDTKVYRGVIPECTNVSVGYENAHTSRELLDVKHIMHLRNFLISIDPTSFVIERDPKSVDTYSGYGGGFRKGWYDDEAAYGAGHKGRAIGGVASVPKGKAKKGEPTSMIDLVWDYADEVSDILDESGIDFQDLWFLVQERIAQRELAKEIISPVQLAITNAEREVENKLQSAAKAGTKPPHPPTGSKPTVKVQAGKAGSTPGERVAAQFSGSDVTVKPTTQTTQTNNTSTALVRVDPVDANPTPVVTIAPPEEKVG